MVIKSKNQKVLNNFIKYCQENPDQRFYQALRNWCGYSFVLRTNTNSWALDKHKLQIEDTYYIEGK
jgi:phage terminase large subunit GpA-like protein